MLARDNVVLVETRLDADDDVVHAHALRIAIAFGIKLEALHVDPPFGDDAWRWALPDPRATLERWRLPAAPVEVRVRHVRSHDDDTDEMVDAEVDDVRPALVVLPAADLHDTTARMHRMQAVLGRGNVPVLLVPEAAGFVSAETGAAALTRILVPVDHHPDPHPALTWAASLARALGGPDGELVTFHVGTGEAPPDGCALPVGWTRRHVQALGLPVDGIVAFSEALRPDLVVVTTEGRKGLLDTLRGSTVERLVPRLHAPVLVVPRL